jgi:hypothetical protein
MRCRVFLVGISMLRLLVWRMRCLRFFLVVLWMLKLLLSIVRRLVVWRGLKKSVVCAVK